jgi:hypothetical protein
MTIRMAIVMFLLAASASTMAQDSLTVIPDDTVITDGSDTVLLKSYASRYDPRKALMYAAVLPGLGQIYNKKYWKLPLVYGGFFGIGYAINFYQGNYTEYKAQLFYNLDHGLEGDNEKDLNDPNAYTTGQLRTIVDKTRRERDFWVIMMGAMYLLQIVDAHVDAHLKEFDLNPTFKVSFRPSMTQDVLMGRQNSMSVVLKF